MYNDLKNAIDNSSRIVFFGGAGVSTESGIPDFRSENGLYQTVSEYGIPPEEIISRSFFRKDPNTFYKYYKENLMYPDAKPNAAHFALAKLEEQGKLFAVVTQNVDGLHQKAGSKNVIQVHGSALRNYCMDCNEQYGEEYILHPAASSDHVPLCEKCNGIVRPDVVLYEESLDSVVISSAVDAISKADMLIVGGTALVVYPAAGFINYFNGKCLVLINKSATAYDNRADIIINDSIGKVLGSVVV
jgi:NAD-dependent deacetylase